jgi:hypothetical protein
MQPQNLIPKKIEKFCGKNKSTCQLTNENDSNKKGFIVSKKKKKKL